MSACERCGGKRCPGDCDGYTEEDMREAGERVRADLVDRVELAQLIAKVREKATLAERERCAKVADPFSASPFLHTNEQALASFIARRIRASGNQSLPSPVVDRGDSPIPNTTSTGEGSAREEGA